MNTYRVALRVTCSIVRDATIAAPDRAAAESKARWVGQHYDLRLCEGPPLQLDGQSQVEILSSTRRMIP